jgi:hypothetical protein
MAFNDRIFVGRGVSVGVVNASDTSFEGDATPPPLAMSQVISFTFPIYIISTPMAKPN